MCFEPLVKINWDNTTAMFSSRNDTDPAIILNVNVVKGAVGLRDFCQELILCCFMPLVFIMLLSDRLREG